MNDRARETLEALGWTADRASDTEGIAARLAARGFPLHEKGRAFLARYGGLRVNRAPPTPRQTRCYFHTDPAELSVDPSWHRTLSEAAGTRIVPIGETAYSDYTLLMDEHGRVFGVDMYGELSFWAEDADELFDIVLGDGGTFRPVYPEDHRPL